MADRIARGRSSERDPDLTGQIGSPWTLPLASEEAALDLVGGKGATLMRLATSGFPVPPGFLITTEAYRRFVAENNVQAVIDEALRGVDGSDPAALERAATAISEVFARAIVPQEIVAAIQQAYAALEPPEPAVAVRSSATAEDLPELSFAGQQETFLDVRGDTPLLDAIRRAWASLWTARAIAYRQQMGVPQDDVAMAIVMQEMVPAEVSGVLFTANPATGNRDEIVIEAAFGLGERIVGGTVTPESYVVARDSLAITRVTPGAHDALATSVGEESAALSGGRALPDPLLPELAELGLRVERLFGGTPQDIEWAVANGRLWLLQARPITNLPPAIAAVWESPEPGATWVRRQVVEHMPEPLSPLFAELYVRQGFEQSLQAIATIPAVTGVARPLCAADRRPVLDDGERLRLLPRELPTPTRGAATDPPGHRAMVSLVPESWRRLLAGGGPAGLSGDDRALADRRPGDCR